MKTIDKIVKRLRGMGFDIPDNPPYCHHMKAGDWSWSVACGSFDIGSMCPMSECLSWKRWHYSCDLHEIFEWHEKDTVCHGDRVEEIEQ